MSVDFRTRSDADLTDIDIQEFFSCRFPQLLENAHRHLEPWLRRTSLPDLSIDCEGSRWHLSVADARVRVVGGTGETGPLLTLAGGDLSGLINDVYTPMTFFVGGNLDIQRGDIGDFLNWWLVFRAALDDRPIHVPGDVQFPNRCGKPLALDHAFHLDDSIDEMRHFLQTAGFLHLAGVFSAEEMAAVSADIDSSHGRYYEGDESSWWASTRNGDRRLVRLQKFDRHSAATRSLLADPRFTMLGSLSGDGHLHRGLEGNAIEALIKPLDVVQGISDLPWHKDCSLGRHSYDCCSLTAGISVTGADAGSGQLRVIAGSHRALMWPALIRNAAGTGLPVVDLPTATGDVTLHLSCTHHMSQAPTIRERRVLYTSFRLPDVRVDSGIESRARINRVREAAYRTVSQ